jgi:hypothetical protein
VAFRPVGNRGAPPPSPRNLDRRQVATPGTESAKSSDAMKMHTNTGVDDREQWRARIQRALQELQGEDGVSAGRLRRDARTEDTAAESAKL